MKTEDEKVVNLQDLKEKAIYLYKKIYMLKTLPGKENGLLVIEKVLETLNIVEEGCLILEQELNRIEKAIDIVLKIPH